MAIMHYIAAKHGCKPQTPDEVYELNWVYETLKDLDKDGFGGAVFGDAPSQEIIDGYLGIAKSKIDALDTRFADGRAHAAGANITVADYSLLHSYTTVALNDHLKNPAVG